MLSLLSLILLFVAAAFGLALGCLLLWRFTRATPTPAPTATTTTKTTTTTTATVTAAAANLAVQAPDWVSAPPGSLVARVLARPVSSSSFLVATDEDVADAPALPNLTPTFQAGVKVDSLAVVAHPGAAVLKCLVPMDVVAMGSAVCPPPEGLPSRARVVSRPTEMWWTAHGGHQNPRRPPRAASAHRLALAAGLVSPLDDPYGPSSPGSSLSVPPSPLFWSAARSCSVSSTSTAPPLSPVSARSSVSDPFKYSPFLEEGGC